MKKTYYAIKWSIDPKVVGSDHPQAWSFTKEYEKREDNPNAVYAFLKEVNKLKRPDYIPDLDGFVLSARAKLTNFVHVVVFVRPFLDEKAKTVLQESCNLGDHEFYEATLYVRKEPKRFYYLESFLDMSPYIEFNECLYWIEGVEREEDLPSDWHDVIFRGYDDIYDMGRRHDISIHFGQLVFNKEFDRELDFFYLERDFYYGVCSERFKKAVENAGLTGLVFTPIDVVIKDE